MFRLSRPATTLCQADSSVRNSLVSKQWQSDETEWDSRFWPLGINALEMVARICPRWNSLTSWKSQIEDFQRAGRAVC